MYRRAGIEMSSYACNDKDQGLDDYFADFSSNMKHIHHAETVIGETTPECNSD